MRITMKSDDLQLNEAIRPKWYTTEQVAVMLGYGLTKTKYLVHSGQIQSVKDGRNRRILPEWVDDYIRNKVEEMIA
jgi:excisionase family DNA binding protein